jgi:hypothetical protein
MANDQCRRIQGKVFPVLGRHRPCPRARLPAPPRTWRPTVRWGCQGGSVQQRSQGRGQGHRFWGVAATAIMPGGIRQRHRRPNAGSHGPGPVPVRGMLGNHRRLPGVIRTVVAGLLPQAHCCGRGRGEHLARPGHGARGRVICQPP